MGKALYRRYRSTSFDEVVGQEHITTTLKNSLANGTIGHAYLLTGPRGVGKTSIARILAFAVNDLPYEKDGIHLDIIEIDAASNRRIDEIRSLRDRVNIAPTSAAYKVYIIDEVHMLTREAFNALLKTLEEPPDHVIFVLATTEIHKLPDTIISRCITFTFRPIDQKNMISHLKRIAKAEKINIDDEAIGLLATHGEGSFRDSISLLDQVKNINNKITASDIELALGLASKDVVEKILQAVTNHDPKQLNKLLEEAYRHGASETHLAKQISELVRNRLLEANLPFPPHQATELLKKLLDVPASPKPRASLELSLLDQLFQNTTPATQPVVAEAQNETVAVDEIPRAVETQLKAQVIEGSIPKLPVLVPAKINADLEVWQEVLKKLKTQNNTLYSIARMAEVEFKGNKLFLTFQFAFHYKQINSQKNKSTLTLIIKELGHKDLGMEINLLTDSKKSPPSSHVNKSTPDKALKNINNIFGSSEVLES